MSIIGSRFFFSFDLFQGGSTPRQRSREAWCLLKLLVRQRKIGDNKGVNKGVNKVCYRDITEAIPMGSERWGGMVIERKGGLVQVCVPDGMSRGTKPKKVFLSPSPDL